MYSLSEYSILSTIYIINILLFLMVFPHVSCNFFDYVYILNGNCYFSDDQKLEIMGVSLQRFYACLCQVPPRVLWRSPSHSGNLELTLNHWMAWWLSSLTSVSLPYPESLNICSLSGFMTSFSVSFHSTLKEACLMQRSQFYSMLHPSPVTHHLWYTETKI